MIFSPWAMCSTRYGRAFSGVPMASSRASAREGAPPCSGPDRAPMPPVTAAARSAPVEVITREVNVEALNPWSIVSIWYCSTARATSGSGFSPVSIHR